MSRSLRLPGKRSTRVILMVALLAVAVGVGGILYLRYFYGNDAPPPFELSSIALFVPRRRSPKVRSSRRRGASIAAVAAVAIVAVGGVSRSAMAASKAPAAGASCTKLGTTSSTGRGTLRCTLVAKKRRWVGVASSAPTTTKPGTAAPTPSTAGEAPGGNAIEGTYKVGAGSAAGYRVRELFVGGIAKVDAVGRSEGVSGTVVLGRNGPKLQLQSVSTTVDMTKLVSDESRRDGRMRTSGIETEKFPTATFVSTGSVDLDAESESGKPIKTTVAGKLTLHGVTRDVQVAVDAQLRSATLEIVGRLAINMKDYAIEPPEVADFVKADDDGSLEFKLVLKKG